MKNKLIQLLREETDINLRELFVGFFVIGVTNALVLVIIHRVAEAGGELNSSARLLFWFILCVTTFSYTKRVVSARLARHVHHAISRLRLRLLDKIRATKLIAYERLDRSQLINAVSENTLVIIDGARHFGQGIPAGIMLVCSFIYIGFISIRATYMVVICVALCAWAIWRLNRSISEDLNRAIRKEDEFLSSFHELLSGFKELKMNRAKSDDLFENHLRKSSLEAKVLNTKTAIKIEDSDIYTYVFFYILLGSILFILPRFNGMNAQEIVSITTILLFLLGNGTVFVQALPNITKTDVAISNIKRLEEKLDELEQSEAAVAVGPWRAEEHGPIELRDVLFTYPPRADEKPFSVFVEDLVISPGELLFLQGGNGSGKSTLLKLITGLYKPTSNRIVYAGVPVTDDNVAAYREFFSPIFTDFHLFDQFYGMADVEEDRVIDLLRAMQLADKTGFRKDRFTDTNLSTGQRKRLALIVAMLEDRPIYMFDEVAADQDPDFRRHFYEDILQDLKKSGKTIIAATHDDRYFHVADRVLKMEYGRIIDERKPGEEKEGRTA